MTTGEKIRQLRKELGMTQEELGNLIGVQKAAINKYETGVVVNLKQATIAALSEALHVSPVELLSPEMTEEEKELSAYVQGRLDSPVPQTSEARILARGIDRLPPAEREQALAVVRAMFNKYADYFEKGNDNEP